MPLYVHAVNTSRKHAAERRRHVYSTTCAQCGVELDPTTHVAAHVVRYDHPVLLPCVGTLTLVTTCRSCNSRHQGGDSQEVCCESNARFWHTSSPARPLTAPPPVVLSRVRRLWCWRSRAP